MTKYDLINNNIRTVVKLIVNDIITTNTLRDVEIFEEFHTMVGIKQDRYKQLAQKYNYKPYTIRRIINNLNSKIK
jgi:Mor family transcriptional regulator